MKTRTLAAARSSLGLAAAVGRGADRGLDPRSCYEAADRRLADLPRRLLGPALQHAQADQRGQRQEPARWPGSTALNTSRARRDRRRRRARDAAAAAAAASAATIKSTPLMVNGVLYLSAPDHVWAVDARTGREIWHYVWKTRGGIHIGNRGVGMYGNWLYFLTPDNYFVSLDAATGKERWHNEIANVKREYFSTSAPIVIAQPRDHRRRRRLARRARLSRVARSRRRGELHVALEHDAAAGRAGRGDLAGRILDGARRRHAVAARHLRSRS